MTVEGLYSLSEVRSSGDLPASWRRAEQVLCERYDLIEDHASWHDARTQEGDPVELKSCVYQYESGQTGEFVIWDEQLKELMGGGKVGLLVYTPTYINRVVATYLVPGVYLLGEGRHLFGPHPTMGRQFYKRVPWPDVIPFEEISLGMRWYFTEHYPEDETRDTPIFLPSSGDHFY